MPFVYDVCNVKLQLYAKGLAWSRGGGGGGKHLKKTFSISYMLNSRNRVFNRYFINQYLPSVNQFFADSLRADSTTFSMEKISLSFKLLPGHFYWQSCIKTVQGPFTILSASDFFQTNLSGIPLELQTVLIEIRPDILLVLMCIFKG